MLNCILGRLIRPIPIALLGAVLAYLWITQGTYAREMARFTVCKNRLWQHSGYHGGPLVAIDRDFRVLSAGGCSLCDDHETPMAFVIVDGETNEYLADSAVIPADTLREAELRLSMHRADPEYQERWQRFKESRRLLKKFRAKASHDAE